MTVNRRDDASTGGGKSAPGTVSGWQPALSPAHRAFATDPDPGDLFRSRSHDAALGSLLAGVEQERGLMALFGDAGTGKSMLLRALGLRVQPRRCIVMPQPPATSSELLALILDGLGHRRLPSSRLERLQLLDRLLADESRSASGSAVMIVDGAHEIPFEVLEEIRLLSNLEQEGRRLVQIILAGRPELERRLLGPQLRQLHQRFAVKAHLAPLTGDETLDYVRFRLQRAGLDGLRAFDLAAISEIYAYSAGIPRTINRLCLACLLGEHARRNEADGEDWDRDGAAIDAAAVLRAAGALQLERAQPPPVVPPREERAETREEEDEEEPPLAPSAGAGGGTHSPPGLRLVRSGRRGAARVEARGAPARGEESSASGPAPAAESLTSGEAAPRRVRPPQAGAAETGIRPVAPPQTSEQDPALLRQKALATLELSRGAVYLKVHARLRGVELSNEAAQYLAAGTDDRQDQLDHLLERLLAEARASGGTVGSPDQLRRITGTERA